jgi:uncharacterized protein YjbI with pentapeptide repeats
MKILIKNYFNDTILFEGEYDNLSIALKEAIKTNADLTNADLRYADLRYADLTNVNLRYADLTNADLRYADLTNADLRYADLTNADLRYADLTNADGIEKYCYFSISPIGSENGQLWVMKNEEGILIYNRGCFKGTEEEFITAVRKKHTGNKYETQYLKAIELIRLITEGENHACKSS